MCKILVVEDEKELGRAIQAILKFSNYESKHVLNGKEALEDLKNNYYDLIIMDVMMPVMDGLEALKTMRNTGINTPVILLTAKSQIDDKVEGLDLGANDYITKPFDKKELLARIRALIRVQEEKNKKFTVGNLYFYKENSEISNDSASLHLNETECALFEYLIKNQEKAIIKSELKNMIWQDEEVNDSALEMYINFLENKFEVLNGNVKINNEDDKYILKVGV